MKKETKNNISCESEHKSRSSKVPRDNNDNEITISLSSSCDSNSALSLKGTKKDDDKAIANVRNNSSSSVASNGSRGSKASTSSKGRNARRAANSSKSNPPPYHAPQSHSSQGHHHPHPGPGYGPPYHPQQSGNRTHHPHPVYRSHPGAPPPPPHSHYNPHPPSYYSGAVPSGSHSQYHGGPPPPHYDQRHTSQTTGPYNSSGPPPPHYPPSSGPSSHHPHHIHPHQPPSFHHQQQNYHRPYPPPSHRGTAPTHGGYPPQYRGQHSHPSHAGATHNHHHSYQQSHHPTHKNNVAPTATKSSASVSSTTTRMKSKEKNRTTSVSSSSSVTSTGSRRKRTIDGIPRDEAPPPSNSMNSNSAFTVHRSSSSSSTCSTTTVGNNTSSETISNFICESPMKRERTSPSSKKLYPPMDKSNNSVPSNLKSDDSPLGESKKEPGHRRSNSSSSTASSLSIGGLSMTSYERAHDNSTSYSNDDPDMLEASPKRQRAQNQERRNRMHLVADTREPSNNSGRFDYKEDRHKTDTIQSTNNLFGVSLSASPIHNPAVSGITPISKNKKTKSAHGMTFSAFSFQNTSQEEENTKVEDARSTEKKKNSSSVFRPSSTKSSSSPFMKRISSSSFENAMETALFSGPGSEVNNEEHSLNRHLREQSFTPLPHVSNGTNVDNVRNDSNSPTFNPALSDLAPQLSWSIAGDTPPLGDIAEWADEGEKKIESRDDSPVSMGDGDISPMFWRSEDTASSSAPKQSRHSSFGSKDGMKKQGRDSDEYKMRLNALSPSSMDGDLLAGKTTPLPLFFDQQANNEERENYTDNTHNRNRSRSTSPVEKYRHYDGHRNRDRSREDRNRRQFQDNEKHRVMPSPSPRSMTSPRILRSPSHRNAISFTSPYRQNQNPPPTPRSSGPNQLSSHDRHDGGYTRNDNPRHRDNLSEFQSPRGVFRPPPSHHINMAGPSQVDRVRNLRGRAPIGASHGGGHVAHHHHHIQHHIPPHQHNLTSPMAAPGGMSRALMWGSPHHLPPHARHHGGQMNASKRKCVPLKTPIPSKFQGDMEKMKTAQVPEFTSLVNFPAHMSQKQSMNLPEGMRCCVMCGHACPCSAANKNKKNGGSTKNKSGNNGDTAPLGSNGQMPQSSASHNGTFAIIPTQNKGLCTHCDVNVWVVTASGLEIKWCKGCKNFRPWAAFGDKGLATKCVRCRERQREKYAAQKEEKEKSKALGVKAGSSTAKMR